MTEMKSIDELFDVLGKILLRCFVMGYVLLLLWFALYVFGGDALRSIQVRLFGLTAHEVDLVNYCGMAGVKCAVLLFSLFPYIAIRWVLRKRT